MAIQNDNKPTVNKRLRLIRDTLRRMRVNSGVHAGMSCENNTQGDTFPSNTRSKGR